MSDQDRLTPANRATDLDKKFTDVRELRSLFLRTHPDVLGAGDVPEDAQAWIMRTTRILNALKDSEQLRFWPADIRDDMTQNGAMLRIVRKGKEGHLEVSEEFPIPKYAHSFLLGLEAYLDGRDWEEVSQLMNRDPKVAADEIVREFEQRIREVQSLEDLESLARIVHSSELPDRAHDKIIGRLSLMATKVLDRQAKAITELEGLSQLKNSVRDLFSRPHFQALALADCMITIDGAALDLAEAKIRSAKTRGTLSAVWAEILTFPFSAKEQDQESLARTLDEKTMQLFLRNIKQKRSDEGLNRLRREIEEHEFRMAGEEGDAGRGTKLIEILEKFRQTYGARWQKTKE